VAGNWATLTVVDNREIAYGLPLAAQLSEAAPRDRRARAAQEPSSRTDLEGNLLLETLLLGIRQQIKTIQAERLLRSLDSETQQLYDWLLFRESQLLSAGHAV